jgi:hypothetical protein
VIVLPAHREALEALVRAHESNLAEMALRLQTALRRPVEPTQSPPAADPRFASAAEKTATPRSSALFTASSSSTSR